MRDVHEDDNFTFDSCFLKPLEVALSRRCHFSHLISCFTSPYVIVVTFTTYFQLDFVIKPLCSTSNDFSFVYKLSIFYTTPKIIGFNLIKAFTPDFLSIFHDEWPSKKFFVISAVE